MGCRVIFSCLKELAKRLRELEAPDDASHSTDAGVKPQHADSSSAPTMAAAGSAAEQPRAEKDAAASHSSFFSFGSMFGSSAGTASTAGEKKADGGAHPEHAPTAGTEGQDSTAGTGNTVRTVSELRGLIKDVVLLGAPLNLKVRSLIKMHQLRYRCLG
jgi:hypothetical protein